MSMYKNSERQSRTWFSQLLAELLEKSRHQADIRKIRFVERLLKAQRRAGGAA